MKNSRILFLAIAIVLVAATIPSCKDDNSAIGTDLMPSSDIMEFCCDTMGIETYAVRDTHVATHNRTINPIGTITDPIFGQTSASCAFQIMLSNSNVQFDKEIDTTNLNGVKLNLQLKYAKKYGSTESAMTININRLLTDIYYDSTYYEDQTFAANQYELLSSTNLVFDADSTIKIEMPESLIKNIITRNVGQTSWNNNDFVKFFKGIYITTETTSGDGCMYALDLINPKSKMILTYNDTCSFDFEINEYSTRINMYTHDYTNADSELKNAIDNPETPTNSCYVQGLAGIKTKIKFPELANLFDSTNIIINRAQLKVTLQESSTINTLPSPAAMSMTKILDNGQFDFLEDYKSNSKYFGGSFDATDNSYTFNIPLHLQNLFKGESDNGIYMVANDNRIVPYRALLYGGSHNTNKIKIIVYYSKY
jgi:hypothetical protein